MIKKTCVIVSAKGRKTFTKSQQELLEAAFDVTFVENLENLTEDDLVNIVKDAQILTTTRRSSTNLSKNILPKLKNLKVLPFAQQIMSGSILITARQTILK